MIAAKLQVIEEVQVEEWWRNLTVDIVSAYIVSLHKS